MKIQAWNGANTIMKESNTFYVQNIKKHAAEYVVNYFIIKEIAI